MTNSMLLQMKLCMCALSMWYAAVRLPMLPPTVCVARRSCSDEAASPAPCLQTSHPPSVRVDDMPRVCDLFSFWFSLTLTSAAGRSNSARVPPDSTITRSQSMMVCRRWAMVSTVQCANVVRMMRWMSASVALSTLLVASSVCECGCIVIHGRDSGQLPYPHRVVRVSSNDNDTWFTSRPCTTPHPAQALGRCATARVPCTAAAAAQCSRCPHPRSRARPAPLAWP